MLARRTAAAGRILACYRGMTSNGPAASLHRRIVPWLTALAVAYAAGGCGTGPPARDVATQIGALRSAPRIGSETLAEPTAVWRFYKARRNAPAWRDRADDVIAAIRGTEADGLDPGAYHLKAIQSMLDERRSSPRTALSEARLDVLLADAMASVADDVHYGRVRPSQVNPEWTADPRDDAPPLDSTLMAIVRSGSIPGAIDQLRPSHFVYHGLTQALSNLRRIDTAGGWPVVPAGKPLRLGAVDRRVAAVRRRLLASGDMTGAVPRDSARYDTALARGVETFQARHRLATSGKVDAATVAAMNVPVRSRIAQLRVNLERARWVLGGLDQDFVLVNLPAYKAYLIRGGRNIWESRIVIGQEARQTPSFRATMQTVVFNPDWTVPPTILAEDVLDGMKQGKNVLAEKRLQVYDKDGNEVSPSSIDWDNASADNFPYTLKQDPGEDNALGRVKFLFPNKYSIYLHDTPSKSLFESNKRTYSSGCIRIERPLDLAEILLSGQDSWTRAKMEDVITQGKTQNVDLEHRIPVVIVYWTVSVGASGEVRYTKDPYDLDAPLLQALDGARRS